MFTLVEFFYLNGNNYFAFTNADSVAYLVVDSRLNETINFSSFFLLSNGILIEMSMDDSDNNSS